MVCLLADGPGGVADRQQTSLQEHTVPGREPPEAMSTYQQANLHPCLHTNRGGLQRHDGLKEAKAQNRPY